MYFELFFNFSFIKCILFPSSKIRDTEWKNCPISSNGNFCTTLRKSNNWHESNYTCSLSIILQLIFQADIQLGGIMSVWYYHRDGTLSHSGDIMLHRDVILHDMQVLDIEKSINEICF